MPVWFGEHARTAAVLTRFMAMQAGSVRLLRITMAFLSVWWLGCQSYDSLAGYLRGSAEVASCMPAMSAPPGEAAASSMPAIAALEQAHECGCSVDCIDTRAIGVAELVYEMPERTTVEDGQ